MSNTTFSLKLTFEVLGLVFSPCNFFHLNSYVYWDNSGLRSLRRMSVWGEEFPAVWACGKQSLGGTGDVCAGQNDLSWNALS